MYLKYEEKLKAQFSCEASGSSIDSYEENLASVLRYR